MEQRHVAQRHQAHVGAVVHSGHLLARNVGQQGDVVEPAFPSALDELLARVRGVLRRRRWDGATPETGGPRSVEIGDVTVHFDRFELETPRGQVDLTTREVALLRSLIEHEGKTVSIANSSFLEEIATQ